MKITPQQFDNWRVFPRLLISLYGIVCIIVLFWFIGLDIPTTQQVTFASTIWGAAPAWFGFYVKTGGTYSSAEKPEH